MAAIVALECGWIVTEVGRQPWIVYEVMRTEDAVTKADGVWVTFALIVVLYAVLGAALVITLRAMARRWREADGSRTTPTCPTGRRARRPSDGAMSSADAVAGVLWVGATVYAVFGGADFGAGFWSLFAGRGERGTRARELIDWAIGPVWEANHVWLIFVLVVLWTGFSARVRVDLLDAVHPAQPRRARDRAARVRVRVPPDGAAAAGAGARRAAVRALVAADAVLHGHRRRRDRGRAGCRSATPTGDPVTSWLNPLSLVIGALFVATGAYLAAVFLVSDARRARVPDLERYFAARALAAAVATGRPRRGRPRRAARRRARTSTTASPATRSRS